MTFIASVVARNGVAVIADSLVTTMENILRYKTFNDYLKEKSALVVKNELELDKLTPLFEITSIYTRDHEEKLFQLDKYTAITTAGSAIINGKRIDSLVAEMVSRNKRDKGFSGKGVKTKVMDFANFLNEQVSLQLKEGIAISKTRFIISHYNKNKERVSIYKIKIKACSIPFEEGEDLNCVSHYRVDDSYHVVSDGQDRICERLLYGDTGFLEEVTPKIIEKVIEKLKIPPANIPADFSKKFMGEIACLLSSQFFTDIKNNALANISLQQAVDLATLLMNVEVKFQELTENIPSVGGLIRLAVIDKHGFRFLTGNKLILNH